MTFGDLAASYLEVHAKRRKRTWAEDERILNSEFLPTWRNLPAEEIRRRDVARILDTVVGHGAPTMANRIRALASKVFAFGLEREIVEFNPVAGLRKPGEERPRERVLADDEIRTLWAIWEAEPSITSVVFRVLLLTGQRKHEVLNMRWADIDGAWWTLPARFVKNKRAHRVYLTEQTLALLASLKEVTGSSEWVFASPRLRGRPVASLNTANRRFRAAAKLPTWRPHDLRRTVSTCMGRLRVPRETIKRVLNHTDGSVTAIYDLAGREHEVEQALRMWASRLDEILRHGQALPSTPTGAALAQ
jgi:integrase